MNTREEIIQLVEDLPEETLDQARSLLEGLRPPVNGKPRYLVLAEQLAASVPEEERKKVPADLTSQLDHYIYGTPKQ